MEMVVSYLAVHASFFRSQGGNLGGHKLQQQQGRDQVKRPDLLRR